MLKGFRDFVLRGNVVDLAVGVVIGAAFGTALVTAILFAVLSMKNPEAARLFATMTEHGAQLPGNMPAGQQADVKAVIAEAFRIAFLSIAAFTAAGFVLALSIPLRRI